jgi:hypothetical protein
MTGCAPAELLGGGQLYFDALVERASERARVGYDTTELLAGLVEISYASYRALLAMGGVKNLPQPIHVERPGERTRRRTRRVNWRELARRVGQR